jgi:hypothetical protein
MEEGLVNLLLKFEICDGYHVFLYVSNCLAMHYEIGSLLLHLVVSKQEEIAHEDSVSEEIVG